VTGALLTISVDWVPTANRDDRREVQAELIERLPIGPWPGAKP
jgi:hypothetical protein